ncbi:MAG TPA: 16S rRNA (cytidine(1402)-2'-O)-methyltransferase [Oligoflexia bacterium]|nr:16S rRNA (cytidine(1402)-2'-O)-methyltransferase [Oligoflexia bacterium]HMP47361.1 16S rRNA (cytidine(1402)-2'-O)-methyltransferase [Oligoflexia bacterium]
MTNNSSAGILYVVALPIGNLEDITLRAIRVLKEVDLICAEDTRTFGRLRSAYDIKTPAESYHEHNERAKSEQVLGRLQAGESVALVSDAGTPLISDPGYRLVKAAVDAGIRVSPVPGPSAATAALSASGLETDQYMFLGFLPQKGAKKERVLLEALSLNVTLVCYESPHRIEKTLQLLDKLCPRQLICSAREISKIYEDIFTGTARQVLQHLLEKSAVKGEFVLIIGKPPKKASMDSD